MNKDINHTLMALVPILQMNGENVVRIEAVRDWYKSGDGEYCKEIAEITFSSGYQTYADIGCDANLTAVYDILAVIQEIKPKSTKIERLERGIYEMPDVTIKVNADHYDGYWMPLGEGVPPVGNALIVTIWDSIRNRRELRYPVMYRKSWTSDTYGFYVLGDENEWLNPEYDKVLAWTLFPEIWEGESGENA